MILEIAGKEYSCATTLRVAYELQKEFGGKPYTAVFDSLKTSTLEDQVRVLYTSFKILNPNVMTFREFLDTLLDAWTLKQVMDALSGIISALTGTDPAEAEKKVTEQTSLSL